MDGDRASGHEDPIRLVAFGKVHDVPVRVAERRKDVTVPDARGQRGPGIEPGDPGDPGLAGLRLGDPDGSAEKLRRERSPRSEEFELHDGVPVVDEGRVRIGHVGLPDFRQLGGPRC